VILTELTETGFLFNSTHRIAFLSLNFLKPNTIKRIGFCWEKLKRYSESAGKPRRKDRHIAVKEAEQGRARIARAPFDYVTRPAARTE
jgi:hypothetical protein